MAKTPPDRPKFDIAAATAARLVFLRATEFLPTEHVEELAREVVSRLAFRLPPTQYADLPEASIESFCDLLIGDDPYAAAEMIRGILEGGTPIETVYLGYIAGASRRLGQMWETDQISFVTVTMGTGRVSQIVRGMRYVASPVLLEGRARSPALFALVPGEQHALGLEMSVDLFRREGGDADVCKGQGHHDIIAVAEARRHGVFVLVAHSDKVLAALIQLSVALRIAQPLTPLVLAGNLIDGRPDLQDIIGADWVVDDVTQSLPKLLELTAQA